MQGTVWHEENGRIVAFASESKFCNATTVKGTEGKLSLQVNDIDAKSLKNLYVSGEQVIPRPYLNDLPVTNNVIDFSSVPTGSSVSVFNEANDEYKVVDFNDPLELTDSGVYRIVVVAPFPYHNHEQTVEV